MRNVVIPNLVGRTVAEAKAIITQNYFEVGLVEHEDGSKMMILILFTIKILQVVL